MQRHDQGYTLIELLIVISVVAILATLAEPLWQESVVRAKETALRRTLLTMRDVLDQYRADRGVYPPMLADVVKVGYLRQVPIDPMTKSPMTWQEIVDKDEGGVVDVHSGSTYVSADGSPYNQW